MMISIDAGKTFHKDPHPFLLKMLSQLRIEKDFLNLLKGIFETLLLTSYLLVRDLVGQEQRKDSPLTTYIHIILKVPANKEMRKK